MAENFKYGSSTSYVKSRSDVNVKFDILFSIIYFKIYYYYYYYYYRPSARCA
jgi:hypothetical protein